MFGAELLRGSVDRMPALGLKPGFRLDAPAWLFALLTAGLFNLEIDGPARRGLLNRRAGIRQTARYSARVVPEPPISAGRSFILGAPSRIGRTVSW